MANPSAPHEHEVVLLRNLESHLINAVQISRALAERFGLNVGDTSALGQALGQQLPPLQVPQYPPLDRLELNHRPRASYPQRNHQPAPPMQEHQSHTGLMIPEANHNPQWQAPNHAGDTHEPHRHTRRPSDPQPSSSHPAYPPEHDQDRPPHPQRGDRGGKHEDDDDNMSLDEMILNVADGDETSDRDPSRPRRHPGSQDPSDRVFQQYNAPNQDSSHERPKLRNNSNQHGQMRTLAHRVPQPLGEHIDPIAPGPPNDPKRLHQPQIPLSSHGVNQDYRLPPQSQPRPSLPALHGPPSPQKSPIPPPRDHHIAFAPLHGPDSMAAAAEAQRQQENHGRKITQASERTCSQCGLPGRYKDGRSVEKWGPGPTGPGTVCDRCRKKMKRVERRNTTDPAALSGRSTPQLMQGPRSDIRSMGSSSPHHLHASDLSGLSSRMNSSFQRTVIDNERETPPKSFGSTSGSIMNGRPPFLNREKDSNQDGLVRSEWSRDDSHREFRYAPPSQLQPISDIRSEGSSGDNRSRGKARESRPRRRTPSFSPSRSPSPPQDGHSNFIDTNHSSSSHERSWPANRSHSPSNHSARSSSAPPRPPDQSNGTHSHPPPNPPSFSNAVATPGKDGTNTSPNESDSTAVDGLLSNATSNLVTSSDRDGHRRRKVERTSSPIEAASLSSSITSVLGKRRSPPDENIARDPDSWQRQRRVDSSGDASGDDLYHHSNGNGNGNGSVDTTI